MTAWTQIASTTLGGSAGSITFSSISGSYRDLVILGNCDFDSSTRLKMRVNGSSANYYYLNLGATGGSYYTFNAGGYDSADFYAGANVSGTWQPFRIELNDYSSTDNAKSWYYSGGKPGSTIEFGSGNWNNTSAVNSITLFPSGGVNFITGTQISLYGIG